MRRIAQDAKVYARMYCKWCAQHGLTPSQGSVRLGYSPDIGNKWAKGLSTPPSTQVRAIAIQMGLPIDRLFHAVETSRMGRLRVRA